VSAELAKPPNPYDYASAPKVVVLACNYCHSQASVTVEHSDRYGYRVPTQVCMRCGLMYLGEQLTAEGYRDFYATGYRPLLAWWSGRTDQLMVLEAYAAILARDLRPSIPKGAETHLDIGGGTEYVAKAIGLRATILDPAAGPSKYERVRGLLEDYDPRGRTWDVVTMCQTVDHLTDLVGGLRKARSMVAPDGVFWCDIVDVWGAAFRNKKFRAVLKIDHPYYLTEDNFEPVLAHCGFDVVRKIYSVDARHVGYVCRPSQPTPVLFPEQSHVREFLRLVRTRLG